MKITDIKQQVKRQDRYSIYVDGKYMFSFSQNELLNLGLRIGQEFTKTELEELQKTAIEDKAYTRSLDLIARRARSEWEVRDYLKRKDYEPDVIDKTVKRLKDIAYLDDLMFASAWVNTRRILRSTSRRKLTAELKQKRVREDIIKEVLEQDKTNEPEVIKEIIIRKRKQSRYQDNEKLMAYLMRQGFNYGDIKEALLESDED